MHNMLQIKFNNQFPEWNWLRQTPEGKGVWKDAQFFVNDDSVKESDFFIVLGGLQKQEKVNVTGKTIFIALENEFIHNYKQEFLDQFDIILTHRRDITHRNVIHTIFPAFWFIGRNQNQEKTISWSKTYDELSISESYKNKKKLISIICSNKMMIEGHTKRLEFLEKLRNHFNGRLDFFGRGINEVPDKWDAIAPYHYHIVLENSTLEDEITEKLYDSFLCETYPFYYGAPNAHDHFPEGSFTPIDIEDSESAIIKIEEGIRNNNAKYFAEKKYECKNLVLNHYNLFEIMYRCAKKQPVFSKAISHTIYPELHFISEPSSNHKVFNRILHKIKSIFISK
jgi:hypothetical protein